MTTVTRLDKLKLMARLGGLPPGTRMIEYTHTFTKTYTNHYYKVITEDDYIADCIEDLKNTGIDPDHPLADYEAESFDSVEIDEVFDGVELLDAAVTYDPNDPDHQRCVDHYIKWELDNTTQNKNGAQQ